MNSLRNHRRGPLSGRLKSAQSRRLASKLPQKKDKRGGSNKFRKLIMGQSRKTNNLLPVYFIIGALFIFGIILFALMSGNSSGPKKTNLSGNKKDKRTSKVVEVSKEDQEDINRANKTLANSFMVINKAENKLKEGGLAPSEAKVLLSGLEKADNSMVSALSMLEKIGGRYQQNFYPKSYVQYRRNLQLYKYKLKEILKK